MLAKGGQGEPWVAIGAGALLLASLSFLLLAFLEKGVTRAVAATAAILYLVGGVSRVFTYLGPRQDKS